MSILNKFFFIQKYTVNFFIISGVKFGFHLLITSSLYTDVYFLKLRTNSCLIYLQAQRCLYLYFFYKYFQTSTNCNII